MKRAALALAVMTVASVLAAGTAMAVVEDTQRGTAGRDAALDRALEDLVALRGGPPGVIAVVQRGQHREVHAFGVRNIKKGLPLRPDDRMRIASTSKAFSGAVALSLANKGDLSLNDTIGKRLPKLPRSWHEITLRQLLDHTSGLPDYSGNPRFQKAFLASLEEASPPEKLLSYVKDKDPRFDPGSRYRYSNSDNIVVGLMVESATDRTYESQLREQVYEPLGLKKTTLPKGTNLKKPYIHGYDNDPSQDPPEDVSKPVAAGWAWASGGMVSTPADLNRFIRGYVGGDLFDQRTRAQQRRLVEGGSSDPPGPGKNSAGLAVFRYKTPCGTVWGHTGNFLGYTQFMAATPDGSRSVVVSVNEQLTPKDGAPGVFPALRAAEGRAVCAALAH
jgi:D-alanyl-D-alanine carboxypeptidase